jgi:hypothetical protein
MQRFEGGTHVRDHRVGRTLARPMGSLESVLSEEQVHPFARRVHHAPNATWMRTRCDFRFHVNVMGSAFRSKMLQILRRLRHQGAFDLQ